MTTPTKRFFQPKTVLDLRPEAMPYVMAWVTVRSWHSNMAMKDKYPNDELVGHIEEFRLDIPESELLLAPDPYYLPEGWPP